MRRCNIGRQANNIIEELINALVYTICILWIFIATTLHLLQNTRSRTLLYIILFFLLYSV